MSVALNGWHPGERSIRAKLGPEFTTGPISIAYSWIDASMPEQHRIFYSRNIPFLPLTIVDAHGRPWAALVSGPRGTQSPGEKAWVRSPTETELVMDLEMWDGDPMLESLEAVESQTGSGSNNEKKMHVLTAGLGIEFPTRRRNKFAGWMERIEKTGPKSRRIHLRVNQAIGNCPKYINVRTLDQYLDASPRIVFRNLDMAPEDRLPPETIDFILQADTVFLGTSYSASESDKERFPSHVGMNARGGRQGFVRVMPSDGRTLILPDYSGNRIMTSLGNVEATSRAGMSFLDFATGDILYVSGTAKNLLGKEAQALMPRQNVLTTLYVEAFIFIRDALPVRQRPGTGVERSPYSPPIKFLAEEEEGQAMRQMDEVSVSLARIQILSHSLATFSFETDKPVKIRAGQTAVLDFTDLLGKQEYAHMAPGREASLNDDRIRTWTISSSSGLDEALETRTFDLTMREKPGGLVTGALFNLARRAHERMPAILEDARPLGFRVQLVGISGSFTLPKPSEGHGQGKIKLLWIAGGIGVTPFLSMLGSISSSSTNSEMEYDVVLLLSTHEPHVLLRLIRDALSHSESKEANLKLALHIFSSVDPGVDVNGNSSDSEGLTVFIHEGRPKFSKDADKSSMVLVSDAKDRLTYLCGPPKFEESALDALEGAGLTRLGVMREGFNY
ncbi:uncharacterized protein FOMMEDRAFT_130037 [Fomitiporia mediterranea MF3/22]|uniref:uncharacterized protein n=1 Tax=Fomitiporia mediterranea (strain MF3/22) TaxID=694068 RepID=UPI0004407CB3|nr:uncharacterized protein FOMMEDRAFT_130037 [Fomitiporia mediterranea MF3/22]EJC98078.1 hypothetical protein FOMMEDRAFT_130037 [Fomitiporia mediterranea MF3/22]